uniref:Lipase n=1 Tax=Fabrea salina TaxID=342563 RepID=A0A7S3I9Z9_9CILI|mmetsp:Transcript_30/g.60  ORF Transcript_30/g.60 Transcript_30/m.60 type:complete len:387 (+) Transcript_30:51-1211(+)
MGGELLFLVLALLSNLSLAEPPEAKMSFTEVCDYYGYRAESHQVTTQDGYILTLFRVPGLKNETLKKEKPAVFLQHGLLDLSDTWIMNSPAPGFMLANAGFDVWFGNSRGSFHSLGHVSLSTKDKAYWEFTWQQMAEFDIPASINYVLKATGHEKLSYVGHSQGTLQMFAHLSEDPAFIEKLNIFVALAPVMTVRHLNIDFFSILDNIPFFNLLADMGIYDFLPNPKLNSLFYYFCDLFGFVCDGLIGFVADLQVSNDNTERFPVILSHEPGGTSTMNMLHWHQMTKYSSYKVQKYDYGTNTNMEVYDSPTPPVYDISKIKGPIALFFGTEDRLADPTDGAWCRETLPAESVAYLEDTLPFGHLTFMWGKDMSYFDKVIDLCRQYS